MASHPPRYNDGVSFRVRDYHSEDFDVLLSIDQNCFPPGISYSRQELKFYLRRPGSFALVAASSQEPGNSDLERPTKPLRSAGPIAESIAGFIVAESGHASGHVVTIDVLATARRSGVGSLLLRAAEDRLRAARCRDVILETAVDNIPALLFYKRHGYCVIRTVPRYYSNGVDALVLKKELGSAA